MSRIASWLIVSAFGVSAVLLCSTYLYVAVMYDKRASRESFAEGVNFAMQTATTVGYGNWEHPARKRSEQPDQEERILQMRAYSVPFMFFGATFYIMLTGVFVASLLQQAP